jgi:hypothetical protein
VRRDLPRRTPSSPSSRISRSTVHRAPRRSPRAGAAARPCGRRRGRSSLHARGRSRPSGPRRVAAVAMAAGSWRRSRWTGRSAAACRSARPRKGLVLVDVGDHRVGRRSSSAAKKADADFKGLVGSTELTVLPLQDLETLTLLGREAGPCAGVDLRASHPICGASRGRRRTGSRSSRSPPTATRARSGARRPCARHDLGAPADTFRIWTWRQPLMSWSLQGSRGGSHRACSRWVSLSAGSDIGSCRSAVSKNGAQWRSGSWT